MKLRVLALDYDGTIATDGALDDAVRDAISHLRERGLVVVLATGRILDDLRCLLGDLRLFDAIVAENGAVVVFPAAGRSTQLGHPVPQAFVDALRGEGVELRVGRSVVEIAARDGQRALAALQRLELPLTLHFNRSRAMVLPQTVSKATGLREALRTLRLSTHNAIAIGDAENDHELLSVCEVGVAVAWGSAALRAAADHVLPGDGPPAVARYLRDVAGMERIAPPPSPRRRLVLGRDPTGEVVALAASARNVLIAGDPRSGKSWVGGLLCEQLVVHQYCTCVIDPEGDYADLEMLPGVVMLGDERPPTAHELTRSLRYPDVSVVIDLSRLGSAEKRDQVETILRLLTDLRRQTGLPHRIVVDEAHYFLHTEREAAILDRTLGGHTLITYRVAGLDPEVLKSAECVIVTREHDPQEAALLHATFRGTGDAERWHATLRDLDLDEAVLLLLDHGTATDLRRFRIAPRLTRHVRHRHKYLDVPTTGERSFRFRFGNAPGPVVASMAELIHVLHCTPTERIAPHVERGDLSRWIADVIGDDSLAKQVREIEEQHRLGKLPDFNGAVAHAVETRYGPLQPLM